MQRVDEFTWCDRCKDVTEHRAQYFGAQRYTADYETTCVVCGSDKTMQSHASDIELMGQSAYLDREKRLDFGRWEDRKKRNGNKTLGEDGNALLDTWVEDQKVSGRPRTSY